jgi:hypothetical protein
MPVAIACPSCGQQVTLHAPEKYAGKVVRCPWCRARMRIPGVAATADEQLPTVELADEKLVPAGVGRRRAPL